MVIEILSLDIAPRVNDRSLHGLVVLFLPLIFSQQCSYLEFWMMLDTSMVFEVEEDPIAEGPDHFSYFAKAIKDLLTKDSDSDPFSNESFREANFKNISSNDSICNSVSYNWPDEKHLGFKNERIESLLHHALATLTPMVNETFESVVAMRRLQSQIESRTKSPDFILSGSGSDTENCSNKKRKTSHSSSSTNSPDINSNIDSRSSKEADDDLQFLLANDASLVQETIKKYSDQLLLTLGHMEKQLEDLLDSVGTYLRGIHCSHGAANHGMTRGT